MVSADKTWGDVFEFGATTAATAAPLLLRSTPVGWAALGTASLVGGAVSAGITYYRTGSVDDAINAGLSTAGGTLLGGAVMSKVLPAAGRLFGSKAGTATRETLEKAATDAATQANRLKAAADIAEDGAKTAAANATRKGVGTAAADDAAAAARHARDLRQQAAMARVDADAAAKEAAEMAPQTLWGRLRAPSATNGGAQGRWPPVAGALIGNNVGHYLGYPASSSKVPVREVVGQHSRPGMKTLKIPDQQNRAFPEELKYSATLDRYLAGEPVA